MAFSLFGFNDNLQGKKYRRHKTFCLSTVSLFFLQTCAHRYEKRQYVNTVQETRDIIGRCYLLSQDLTIKDPKDDESAMDGGEWSFCDGRLRGHEKFGSCQQGVAATFTRDYHYVVFGAPGTYNWKGMTLSFPHS